jgi:hypothetical protein
MRQWGTVLTVVWFFWAQDEYFWSYKLLNIIPGPTRGTPYISDEFDSQVACKTAYLQAVLAQGKAWQTPEAKEAIQKYGGLRSATHYACIPAPFKPERIDYGEWK